MIVGHLNGVSVKELLMEVKTVATKASWNGSFEYEDSLMDSIVHMEEHVEELDSWEHLI